MSFSANNIEEILYNEKKISKEQLSAVKLESANTGDTVESVLLKRELISSDDLLYAKSKSLGIGFVDPSTLTIDPLVLDKVSQEMTKKYLLVPFELKEGVLHIAMADPLDIPSIELVERKTGLKVKPFMAAMDKIQKTIENQYGKSLGRDVEEVFDADIEGGREATKLEENLKDVKEAEGIVQDSSIARVVSIILEYAVKSGASDIHIEPQEQSTRVRFRIDGVLQEKLSKIPKNSHDSIIARIKILADLKIDEKRKPQDGRFKVEVGKTKTDLRVSTLPTVHGEKVVIRLLKAEGTIFSLIDLGLRGNALRNFDKALLRPNGIILVTGPTGSGKTVTLATALSKINTTRINIMTLEDPVEIKIPGINQVQINTTAGLTFASGLRSFLRQDPDVIMVGEIRDSETAALAVQAALTGHLVLATLHTNSAAGSIPRLLDMNVESFLLSSTIVSVLAQRLVRKICPFCKEKYEAPAQIGKDIITTLGPLLSKQLMDINSKVPLFDKNSSVKETEEKEKEFESQVSSKDLEVEESVKASTVFLYRGKGCDKCNDSGYKGRLGIYEVLDVNEKIGTLITARATTETIHKEATSNGMITLVQDGYIKAIEGITSIEEVLRVAEG
ncbi:type II/IV secretion system protein [Patescibacteria group bacterium]|nr:type II/IV secretion system protein [Patescibacteria group bacterium]